MSPIMSHTGEKWQKLCKRGEKVLLGSIIYVLSKAACGSVNMKCYSNMLKHCHLTLGVL